MAKRRDLIAIGIFLDSVYTGGEWKIHKLIKVIGELTKWDWNEEVLLKCQKYCDHSPQSISSSVELE